MRHGIRMASLAAGLLVFLPAQTVPARTTDSRAVIPSAPMVDGVGAAVGVIGLAVEGAAGVRPVDDGLTAAMALPGERVVVTANGSGAAPGLRVTASDGVVRQDAPDRWSWEAPDTPGVYSLSVGGAIGGATSDLTAFVLRPYHGEPAIEGFRIGRYPTTPLRGDPAYVRPAGLIEVTDETRTARLSPHFQLWQFLCKQEGGYPKYLVVRPALVAKLEALLARIRERGIDAETLHVMSGYRTPAYNAAIGNTTTYSRHAYGDAADVFVDRDGDGRMDDLDGDGRVSANDARVLFEEADALSGDPRFLLLAGGLGLYGPAPHRGPFVHVDTRGRKARW